MLYDIECPNIRSEMRLASCAGLYLVHPIPGDTSRAGQPLFCLSGLADDTTDEQMGIQEQFDPVCRSRQGAVGV